MSLLQIVGMTYGALSCCYFFVYVCSHGECAVDVSIRNIRNMLDIIHYLIAIPSRILGAIGIIIYAALTCNFRD